MSRIIEIKDKDSNGVLNFDLTDILKTITGLNLNLKWIILELEAKAVPNSDLDVLKLEEKINNSKRGLELSWAELTNLSQKFLQVINTTIIGANNAQVIPYFDSKTDLKLYSEIYIQAIDSSVWRVFSNEPRVIENIFLIFRDITIIA